MLDIPSVSAIIAALGVLIGVAITVIELRNLVKTRQTDLVIRLSSTFDKMEFSEAFLKIMTTEFKDVEEAMEKCSMPALYVVGNFYERVGVLLHRKLIDVGLVHDLLPVTTIWEKMKPWCLAARQKYGQAPWEWFEYLYNETKKYRTKA